MAASSELGNVTSSKNTFHLSERCSDHNLQTLAYYCVACECKICSICYSESHKKDFGCDVVNLTKTIKELQDRKMLVNQSIRTLQDLCVKLRDSLKEKQQLAKDEILDIRSRVDKAKAVVQENTKICLRRLCHDLNDTEIINQTQLDCGKALITDVSGAIEKYDRQSEQESLSKLRFIHRSREKVAKMHQTIEEMQTKFRNDVSKNRYKTAPYSGVFADLRTYSLVGGVMVYDNQLVHVFDERKMFGWVRVVGIDQKDPYTEYWRHIFTIEDDNCPVVMSNVKMTYKNKLYQAVVPILLPEEKSFYHGEDHVLFAVGVKVFIVSTNRSSILFECYETFSFLSIEDLNAGSFITSITASCKDFQADDRFLISVSDSEQLREYRVSGEVLRVIDTNTFLSSTKCIAYTDERIAVIDSSNKDVILLTTGDVAKTTGSLKPPLDHLPVCVVWTGSTYLVLFVKDGKTKLWKLADYEMNGQLIKVHDEGMSRCASSVPVSVTRWKASAFITFADNTIREFQNRAYLGF